MDEKIIILAFFLLPVLNVDAVGRDNLTKAEALAMIIAEIQTEAIKSTDIAQIEQNRNYSEMLGNYGVMLNGNKQSGYLKNRSTLTNQTPDAELKKIADGPVRASIGKLAYILERGGDPKDFRTKLSNVLKAQLNDFVSSFDSGKKFKFKTLPTRNKLSPYAYLAAVIADIQGKALEAIVIARVKQSDNVKNMKELYEKLIYAEGFLGKHYVLNKQSYISTLKKYAEGPLTQSVTQLGEILKLSNDPPKFQAKSLDDCRKQIQAFIARLALEHNLHTIGFN